MKKKILVVEDEKTLCLLYEEELSKEGYDITAVTDAEAALVKLNEKSFDLIITDIRMPGKNGIELITQIMGLRKDCLLYTSPSPRDLSTSRMPSSA